MIPITEFYFQILILSSQNFTIAYSIDNYMLELKNNICWTFLPIILSHMVAPSIYTLDVLFCIIIFPKPGQLFMKHEVTQYFIKIICAQGFRIVVQEFVCMLKKSLGKYLFQCISFILIKYIIIVKIKPNLLLLYNYSFMVA